MGALRASKTLPKSPQNAPLRHNIVPGRLKTAPGRPKRPPVRFQGRPEHLLTYVRTISFVGRELARRVLALESTYVRTYMVKGLSHFYYSPPPCNPRLRPIVPRLSSRPTPRPPRNEEAPSSTAPSRRGHGGSLAYPFEITAQNSLLSSPPLGEKGWFSDV